MVTGVPSPPRSSRAIDLNADLGEGFGRWTLADDDALLDLVSSANVACGFHAGDPGTMRRVADGAVSRGVAIGAHVSYRDLAGFGRRFVDVDPVDLADDVVYQIAALDGFARVAGDRVRYVKPHGALYHAIVHHEAQARAVVDAVRAYDPDLPILGPPWSAVLEVARSAGLPVLREAFADRGYLPSGELVPRGRPGAVVHDPDQAAARAVGLATTGSVRAVDGSTLRIDADSLCVHSDTPGALGVLGAVRRALDANGVEVRAAVPAARRRP